ncbi:prepilin peptidase [Arthrobacter sp. MYb211]|nr:prepilin peptidase [Arthrobacter sp. MYb224]PQZ98563.1 prepilin peptidase [Arthrobacter sp. MYb229]PRA09979.1 prepilin peptidase [Arthrobacter sp. MYb221]PRB47195.1 prepilin peptidase [Arthrobacter sp. MYb216]PRC05059.1 prepilin peptidase [Arthrobacter sp. MYb211]
MFGEQLRCCWLGHNSSVEALKLFTTPQAPLESKSLPAYALTMIGIWQESVGAALLLMLFCACFLGFGVSLAVADVKSHRLPNRWLLRWAAASALLLLGLSAVRAAYMPLLWALLGAVILGGAYLVLALVSRGSMGMGDVKLAAVLGLNLGYFSLPALFVGSVFAFVLASLVVLAGIIARKLTAKSAVAFGPFMILGAALALLMTR